MTHRERIADFIRRFPGRDDDEISASLKIRHRQTVNIICRGLETDGQIKRRQNPTGKIGNYPLGHNALNIRHTLPGPIDKASEVETVVHQQKPSLPVDTLVAGGFVLAGRWVLSKTNDLIPDRVLPKGCGVYAFAKDGFILYVGVATMGLAKRLYFYSKPSVSQLTSLRLNSIIKNELLTTPSIDIYTAEPVDLEWNGLPVHGSAGLELGLIKKYALPWNVRSAK